MFCFGSYSILWTLLGCEIVDNCVEVKLSILTIMYIFPVFPVDQELQFIWWLLVLCVCMCLFGIELFTRFPPTFFFPLLFFSFLNTAMLILCLSLGVTTCGLCVCAELSLLASPRTCAMMWTHEVVLFDFSLWSCHFPRLTVRVCMRACVRAHVCEISQPHEVHDFCSLHVKCTSCL